MPELDRPEVIRRLKQLGELRSGATTVPDWMPAMNWGEAIAELARAAAAELERPDYKHHPEPA